tara:strand:+ start:318 stop:812 length:495 start_codon:yes stop_codon:yes gene_type:complete
METPNKMIGGIAGAMAQQPGVLGGTTNLGVQPQPGAASVAPQQPPSVFNNNENLVGQKMFGTQQPGSYDRVMSQAGATGPLNKTIDPSTARNMVSAAGNANPMREAAKLASDVNDLNNKDNPDAFSKGIADTKRKKGMAIYNALTQEGKDITNEYLTGKRKITK